VTDRDAYVTRACERRLREVAEVIQEDLAAALGCDRSLISHRLHLRRPIPADELEVWCDVLDTVEPLRAIARRLGHDVVPLARPAAALTIERGGWDLLRNVGAFGALLGGALEDGSLDDAERAQLRAALVAVRAVVEGLLARLGGEA